MKESVWKYIFVKIATAIIFAVVVFAIGRYFLPFMASVNEMRSRVEEPQIQVQSPPVQTFTGVHEETFNARECKYLEIENVVAVNVNLNDSLPSGRLYVLITDDQPYIHQTFNGVALSDGIYMIGEGYIHVIPETDFYGHYDNIAVGPYQSCPIPINGSQTLDASYYWDSE